MTFTLEQSNTYFATHMDAAYWVKMTDDQKTAVISMAEDDILARLKTTALNASSVPQMKAVCEQAVYLYRNYERQNTGREITGQSLDGLGSQSFTITGEVGLSPRAKVFIDQAIRERCAGPVRFYRG